MSNEIYGQIIGWGSYAPGNVVTNYDLEELVDTSHDWIVQRTGIQERHFAEGEENGVSMALAASREALYQATLEPTEIDLIIVGTCLVDHLTPSVASFLQHELRATHAAAFDVSTGCTGFLYSLSTAYQFVKTGAYQNILVVGVEHITQFLDYEDRSTAVLFGDGAGAVVVQATDRPCGLEGFLLGSDGSQADELKLSIKDMIKGVNSRALIKMNGPAVFRFASRVLGSACQQVLDQAGLTMDDVDWIVPHQANLRIIKSAARDMGVSIDRFYLNIDKYANTSAASIPIALAEGLNNGKIKPTDRVMMVAFGAGLTWAATLVQLTPETAVVAGGVQNSPAVSYDDMTS